MSARRIEKSSGKESSAGDSCGGCDLAARLAEIRKQARAEDLEQSLFQVMADAGDAGAEWIPLLPALCAAAEKMQSGKHVLITLDGPCASGKTTIARKLAEVLEADVLHTDDFVVPHAQKTPERLSVPGGNCDWERLTAEVLAPWKNGERPAYRRYDWNLDGLLPSETPESENAIILEGSYCNLPAIRAYADVRLFLVTSEEIRMERLRERESPESLKRFFERWIPLENAYFEAYHLPDEGIIRIQGTD